MILVHFHDKPFNIIVIQIYAPVTDAEKAEADCFYEDLQHFTELKPKNYAFFIGKDRKEKVGSEEIAKITSKFDLRVQNEAGQRLAEFYQENMRVIANTLFQQPKR